MRTYNHIYHSKEVVKEFLKQINISKSESVVVRIHGSVSSKDEMNSVIGVIKGTLPDANIIGCSSKYIINDGEIQEGKCLISVSTFEHADITTGRISTKNDDGEFLTGEELGEKLVKKIPENETGFMLVFFPYAYSRIDAVVETVNKSGRRVKMGGGTSILEDENGQVPEDLPYVIEGDKASTYDMVYAYIRDPKLTGYGDYACGIESVGKKQPIKTEGTIVKEVGGVPAVEWYTNLLGEDGLKEDPGIAEAFPLVMNDGRELAYHIAFMTDENTKEHYLQTFPELKTGSKVSTGFFNPQKIFDQVSEIIEKTSQMPSESIYIYDCHARAGLLSNCAHWEIGNFRSTNASGALLGGEIITREDKIFYANYTFVVVTLSEDPQVFSHANIPDISSIQVLQEENVQTLNYLLSNSNKMLSKELDTQRSMVENAVFYNPSVGIYNQLKFQYDMTVMNLNKSALFCLENEKMIRLFSGVTETYAFLSDCYGRLTEQFLRKGLSVYSYQDTSLMIAATDEIDENTFEIIVDNIQEFLNNMVCEEIQLSYTAVTYFGVDSPITGLEMALDYAHSRKLHRVMFNELEQDLENEHEHIHILWVLREALVHKRIMPYYQEIHSNIPGKRRLFEALMRITDEEGKVYFPDQFLHIAKEYALYDGISELMVGSVMDHFKNLDCRVSINLNVQDIYNHNMIKMIFDKMKSAPNPNNYIFEIVETEAVSDYEYIKNFADRIHEYGGKIAIDDFGSGYSNLLHLFSIDADYIKIDGEVIKAINKNPLCRDLIEFIQGWCKKNSIALVCEYVEDKSIQDIMEELDVPYSQGYYFSKPHPWDDNL